MMDEEGNGVIFEIAREHLLIVEGKDEENFFSKVAVQLKIDNIQIIPIGGKHVLRRYLPAAKRSPGFSGVKVMGIVQDADDKPGGTLQSIQKTLDDNDLPAPARPLVPEGQSPSVTIMILPGSNRPGALETLCLESVSHDPAMPCVEEYLACLKKNRIKIHPNLDKSKAYAFMASRKVPVDETGLAAQKSYWDLEAKAFDEVKRFMRQVAGVEDNNTRKRTKKEKK